MTGAWPKNMPRTLQYPYAGADAILAGAARAYPDKVALLDGDESLTFAALRDKALRTAAGLRERGIRPGDVVALHMSNSLWYIVAYYGALCAGAAVAPINPAQPAPALRRQLDDVGAKAVVTSGAGAGAVAAAGAGSVWFTVCVPPTACSPAPGELPEGTIALAELLAAEPLTGYRVDPELVAHLQLTGGTTGRSKAVRVLHRNLSANVVQAGCWRTGALPVLDTDGALRITLGAGAASGRMVPLGEGSSLAVAPLFHGLGLVSQNINTLLGTTTVFCGGRFDPEAFLADIEKHRVVCMSGSPAMYYAVLRSPSLDAYDLSSVRMVVSGAAPIDTTALRRLAEVFPRAAVAEGYGLSEATMGLTGSPIESDVRVPVGSVGIPMFDTEVQIRDHDASTVLTAGETGEVWARGPQITDGYHGEPELTALQFKDGWLATGDMGRLDERGNLFLVGRSKDMIIYKGYNVYPQPLEEILCSHPAVAQAAVVGAHSETAGEIPVGFVVLRPGFEERDTLAGEILAHLAERVAPYQKVRVLRIVEALPLTPTGKILKSDLRDRLAAEVR
ncbi:class I adenylate-forming enzyme family protein [Streptomyces sp. NPDC050738]|uniref:class I adenylate-forming enzyme family protein n=1 Tax=Streptomyces sp. NPDC050738 TaxID=3154744 RepID=UPI003445EFAE